MVSIVSRRTSNVVNSGYSSIYSYIIMDSCSDYGEFGGFNCCYCLIGSYYLQQCTMTLAGSDYLERKSGSIALINNSGWRLISFCCMGAAQQTTSFLSFTQCTSYFLTTSLAVILPFGFPSFAMGFKYFLKDIQKQQYLSSIHIKHEQFTVPQLYVHNRMTKFFIPIPRGAPKGFAHPPRQKKSGNCVATLQKKVMQVLKKLLTRQIQKTIRKLKEKQQAQPQAASSRQGLVTRLEQLKSIGKTQLKQLSLFIMHEELNVETEAIIKLFQTTPPKDANEISEPLKVFYQTVKGRNLYKGEIEDAQKIRNTVAEKKKIKKDKAKQRKKTKVAVRKEKGEESESKKGEEVEEMENEEESQPKQQTESDHHHSEGNGHSQSTVKQTKSPREHFKARLDSKTPHQKTEFKKTGRNKYLQEKKNQKKGPPPAPQQHKAPAQTTNIPGRHETPHPSWQAKREIKNQMFLQPFQGKRILL